MENFEDVISDINEHIHQRILEKFGKIHINAHIYHDIYTVRFNIIEIEIVKRRTHYIVSYGYIGDTKLTPYRANNIQQLFDVIDYIFDYKLGAPANDV